MSEEPTQEQIDAFLKDLEELDNAINELYTLLYQKNLLPRKNRTGVNPNASKLH